MVAKNIIAVAWVMFNAHNSCGYDFALRSFMPNDMTAECDWLENKNMGLLKSP